MMNTRLCTWQRNLRSLQWHSRVKNGSPVLWINMICCDQTKTRKRNFQASLIGQIYDVS